MSRKPALKRPPLLKGKGLLRLALYAILSGLITLFCWAYYDLTWEAFAGAAAASLLIEGFFFHRRQLASAAVVAFHLLFTAAYSFTILTFFSGGGQAASGQLYAFQVVTAAFFVVALSGYVAYTFSQGRIWLNLLVAFILYNTLLVVANTVWTLEPVIAALIGAGAALLYLIARSIRFRTQKALDDLSLFPWKQLENPARTSLRQRVTKKFNIDNEVAYERGVSFYKHRGVIVAVFPVAAHKELLISGEAVTVDGNDVSGLFSHVLKQAGDFAAQHKIPRRKVTSAVVVKDAQGKRLASVKVRSTRSPDKVEGTVFLVSEPLVGTFANSLSKPGRRLSKRILAQLPEKTKTD